MNIGICCYPSYGGSGVVATELGLELAKRGHNVHFISYDTPFRLEHYQNNVFFHEVEIVDYPVFKYPPYMLALASEIAQVIRQENLDIIHAHYAIPHTVSAYLAKQMVGGDVKLVTTLHGTDITVVGNNPILKEVTEFAINQSDLVTAVSNNLSFYTKEVFDIKRDIETVYNFIDTNRFKRKEGQKLKDNLVGKGKKVIIHISNFRPVKRVEDIIKVFMLMRKKVDASLIMVGDGPERCKAYTLAQELGVLQHIHFLGKQTDVVSLLSMSDIFLLPSEIESFGLAALEAMACGVPVISSNTGGLPEINVHGVTGYLANVGDVECMAGYGIQMLENNDLLKDLRNNAVNHVKSNFNAKQIISRYEALYARVLNQPAGIIT